MAVVDLLGTSGDSVRIVAAAAIVVGSRHIASSTTNFVGRIDAAVIDGTTLTDKYHVEMMKKMVKNSRLQSAVSVAAAVAVPVAFSVSTFLRTPFLDPLSFLS